MQDWEFLKPFIYMLVSKFKGRKISYEQIHEQRVRIIYLVLTDLITGQTDPNFTSPKEKELYCFARDQLCNILDKEPAHLARFIWAVQELAKHKAFKLYAHEKAF